MFAALLAFGAGLVAMMGAPGLTALLASQGTHLGLRSTLVLAEVGLVAPALLFLAAVRGLPSLDLPVARAMTLAWSLALGCALWLMSAGLLELQSTVFPPSAEFIDAFRRLHASLKPSGPLDALLSILTIAITPAVCEEILFRGVLLPSFARRIGAMAAVIVSATIFAAIHVDLVPDLAFDRVPFALLMGLALGAIRVRTGSLLPAIVAHAAVNTLTFAIAPLVDDPTQTVPDPQPLLGLGLLLVGAAGSTFLLKKSRPSLTSIESPPTLG